MILWNRLAEAAQEVIEETLESLPQEVKVLAEQVPLTFESVPSEEMRREQITEDTLGLFVGESYEDSGDNEAPLPGQILLFLENIWDFAEEDVEAYREEVRVTYLHELGHYLGWDEHDLFNRDLD